MTENCPGDFDIVCYADEAVAHQYAGEQETSSKIQENQPQNKRGRLQFQQHILNDFFFFILCGTSFDLLFQCCFYWTFAFIFLPQARF